MAEILVLLAEDEALIQISTQDALEGGGYRVIAVSNGDDALAVLDDRYRELAGLVTDVRLGDGPDGWEVARHARELNPLIAVVYATGDSAADWAANGVPNSAVLQKPFAEAQLVTALSNLLNDVSATPVPPPAPVEE
jgi:CheY-like chemotaxis protein